MLKRDFFLQALSIGAHLKRAWVNSVFAQIVEEPNQWQLNPTPYRVIATETGYDALIPAETDDGRAPVAISDALTGQALQRVEITDAFAGQPLCQWLEAFTLAPGELTNHTGDKPLYTTYGNVFVNHLILVLPFMDEIAFQTGHIDPKAIEKLIEARLTDDPGPDDGIPSPPGVIYVREYQRFCDYTLSLVGYNQIAVQSISRKSLFGHPDARTTRDVLKEKYKGRLNDPAVIAAIGKELEKLDRDWLKGDPSEGFYDVKQGKYYGKVRKRLYYMFGGEAPFSDGMVMQFIERSLEEGIIPEDLPVMINSLRHGSYNRGAQTQLGGEATKTIYRMVGTSRITEEDCGTTLGVPFTITETNQGDFTEFWQVVNNTTVLLTPDKLKAQIGKTIHIRSPLTCKTEGRNVCEKCVGTALAELKEGLAATAAQVSGRFLTSMLSSVHGKELKTERVNLDHWIR